jgi:hypothetical protein
MSGEGVMASDGEMVDRVAEAAAGVHGWQWSEMTDEWDRQDERAAFRNYWRKVARAAIATMREPTEAMWRAAAIAKEYESKWLCMIDAALANPSEIPNSSESAE